MTAQLQVYKAALQSLADQGNEQAIMALAIGEKMNEPDNGPTVAEGLEAIIELGAAALKTNGEKWSSDVDSKLAYIQQLAAKCLKNLK